MEVKETDPDAQLLRKMQTGAVEESDWQDFVERVRRWIVLHYAFLHAQSDDLAGEAALRVFESVPAFRGESRFIGWVYRIAQNVITGHLRHQAGVTVLSFEEMSEEVAAEDAIRKLMLQLAAEAAMQTLTEQERSVFMSRVTHDTDHQEIAQRLGISHNASRQTWMRASEKIGRYRRENPR
jgi:RNA polymerase sigma-70 factor (ECF subfamily)